jgi:hypothetical protein
MKKKLNSDGHCPSTFDMFRQFFRVIWAKCKVVSCNILVDNFYLNSKENRLFCVIQHRLLYPYIQRSFSFLAEKSSLIESF